MEKVKQKSLRGEFFAAVTVTLALVAALSAVTVWGCLRLRQWLVPDTNYVTVRLGLLSPDGVEVRESARCEIDGEEVRLNALNKTVGGVPLPETYDADQLTLSAESVDYGIGYRGPRRKAAYLAAGAAMGVLPAAYALTGTLLCALWFYRRKLSPAIAALDDAARHIREQDLDFTVSCPLDNELGRLCGSFEAMRQALADNNRQLWRTVEQRRTLQASVAHDLRNPLAILRGHLENLEAASRSGGLTPERLDRSLADLTAAAERMERYTDTIRDLDALEDTEPQLTSTPLPDFLREAASGVDVLAEKQGLTTFFTWDGPPCTVRLDRAILYRVLENLVSNAARFAKSRVDLSFSLRGPTLTVRVTDDGPGFSEKLLRRKGALLGSESPTPQHPGLGLAASRILCAAHGGALTLRNDPGASVTFTLAVGRAREDHIQ